MAVLSSELTLLYIGYFNRFPDPDGAEFWGGVYETGFPLDEIAEDFSTQAEAIALYGYFATPSIGTPEQFLIDVYANLFNREPDGPGLAFWSSYIEAGGRIGDVILSIIEGAVPADQAVMDAKLEVAKLWSERVDDTPGFVFDDVALEASRNAVNVAGTDPEDQAEAISDIELFFAGAPSITATMVVTALSEEADTSMRIKVAEFDVLEAKEGAASAVTLTGADAALFEIDGTDVFLRAGAALDFETLPTLSFTIEVDDDQVGDSPDDTQSFTLTVVDVNEGETPDPTPTDPQPYVGPTVSLQNVVAALSEAADTSARLKVADIQINMGSASRIDLLLTGADASFFEIDGRELFLREGTVLDFETNPALDLTIEVDDLAVTGLPNDTSALQINLIDVNEAPTLAAGVLSAIEDGPTVDIDLASLGDDIDINDDGTTLTYTITGAPAEGSASITGTTLSFDPGAEFQDLGVNETRAVEIDVTATDAQGLTAVNSVTVTIEGRNDAPLLLALSGVCVSEDTGSFAPVLAATDVDGDALSFAITGGADAALFEVDAATGALSFLSAPVDSQTHEVELSVDDGNGGTDSQLISIEVAQSGVAITPRINEIHYDNDGADEGEFVEVRVDAGTDVSAMSVELLNGSNGSLYGTAALPETPTGSDGTHDYYVLDITDFGVSGIQNGSPDGVALIDGGTVLEFLSYEGSFTAGEGTVAGLTSTDIGVSEGVGTAIGTSLQRNNDGPWDASAPETRGAANDPLPATVALNEIAVSTTDTDWEFAELFGVPGTSLDGYALLQIDGDGEIRSILDFSGLALGANGFALAASDQAEATFGVEPDLAFADNTFTNTSSTFLLVDGFTGALQSDDLDTDDDGVLDVMPFSYVVDSVALVDPGTALTYSANVVGPDGIFLAPGAARSVDGAGTFAITDFTDPGGYSPTPAAAVFATTYAIASLDDDAFEGDSGTTGFSFEITRAGDLSEAGSVDVTIGGDVDGDDLSVPTLAATVTFAPGQGCATLALDVTGDLMPEDDEALTVTLTNPVGGEIVERTAGVTVIDDDMLISAVQGAGAESPLLGQSVTVEAVVTKVISNGFFLQEEDADSDGDDGTSEGIFVFTGSTPTVAVGDLVQADGIVDEFFDETQIELSGLRVISSNNAVPTAAAVLLSGSATNFEAVEGMRIALDSGIAGERITVTESFNLDRFGEIAVSAGNKYQPTQLFDAQTEAAEIVALAEANANNRLTIDDGVSGSNPDAFEFIPNTTPGDNGNGYLDAGDTFTADGPTLRLGAEIEGTTTGVMRFAFSQYRMLVDEPLNIDPATNERPDGFDDVGGTIQVAAFNVLNYFTTLSGNTVGPNNLSPRGATTEFDLDRQTDKIVAAVLGTGAEVLALQEIENDGFGAGKAPDTLVAAINAEIGSDDFAYVDPTGTGGFIGTDAITTGMIFDQTQLSLLHSDFLVFEEASAADTFALAEVLNDVVPSFYQLGDFQRNRPAVAATFEDLTTGETFTMVSVHFKSKGDSGLEDVVAAAQVYLDGGGTQISQDNIDAVIGDANFDAGDGQGFWNQVRADAAAELFAWLETSYRSGVEDYLVMGDLNAYAKEDPLQTLTDTGMQDLIDSFIGQDEAYSFVFDGQRGSLDQALTSGGMADAVTGVAEWHINADEPDLLNYNSRFNNPNFYEPSLYAASDHDPVIVGLEFGSTEAIL